MKIHVYSACAILTVSTTSLFVGAFVVPLSSSVTTPKPSTFTSLYAAAAAAAKIFKVFIDGEAGTTGLQVRQRLEARDDLEIISPPSDLRKDEATRKKLINEADAVILCELCKLFQLQVL